MNAAVIVVFYGVIGFIEIMSTKKTGEKKEMIFSVLFLLIALVLSMLIAFDIKIPTFRHFIGDIVTSITGE